MTRIQLVATVGLGLALSACGSNPPRDEGIVDTTEQRRAVVQPVTIDGLQDGTLIDPNSIAGRAPLERVIYFDYDQAELRPEFLDIVAQHGRFMAENPDARVRLEGHTDERGTREYNIALGEERAKTISRMLQLQGVSSSQLRTVSYGEELPVDEAHNSDAWAKNRRVNVIYEVAIQN
ncbi:MAG: peptidoglycan-associated lipoprotein Pal [Granulosicoccus sp.]